MKTEDRTILITGATSGFGEAAARIFAENKWRVIITGRREERLKALSRELQEKFNAAVLSLCFDVSSRKEVEKAIKNIPGDWKDIDVLVNNAGLAAGLNSFQEGNIDDWERMIDTNVKGLLYMTRFVAPMMISRKQGHIINIGSVAGKEVYPNGNVYCGTKHAVDALNKAMRIDMVQHGIKVTQIAPGLAETEFAKVRFAGDEEKAKLVYKGIEPLTGKDIAETIWWVVNRPAHVNILDLVITPAAQATSTTVIRK